MDDQDTRATEPASPDRAADVAVGEGREDDRNEEIADSPVPDPTDGASQGAGDVPSAD